MDSNDSLVDLEGKVAMSQFWIILTQVHKMFKKGQTQEEIRGYIKEQVKKVATEFKSADTENKAVFFTQDADFLLPTQTIVKKGKVAHGTASAMGALNIHLGVLQEVMVKSVQPQARQARRRQ